MMRKVLYKKWIPAEYVDSEGAIRTRIEGTGCFQPHMLNEGLFHQWGCAYDEYENGPGNYTVAIIENADGTIEEVLPTNLKFIETEMQNS